MDASRSHDPFAPETLAPSVDVPAVDPVRALLAGEHPAYMPAQPVAITGQIVQMPEPFTVSDGAAAGGGGSHQVISFPDGSQIGGDA